tara:strand:- start:297 stop:590 length:294 start_codon:yes stop_codon:yes gene_type:complete
MFDLTIDDIELFLELDTCVLFLELIDPELFLELKFVDLLPASLLGHAADLTELFLEPDTMDFELFLASVSCELILASNDLELFLAFTSFDEACLEPL